MNNIDMVKPIIENKTFIYLMNHLNYMGKETWTNQEIGLLKKEFHNHNLKDLNSLLPNRTLYGLRNKAQRIGLKKDKFNIFRYKRKYDVNLNYFRNLNAQSCYWLGFISADGCVLNIPKRSMYGLTFTIKNDDQLHLKKLKDNLGGSPIKQNKNQDTVYYRCSSKQLAEQLIALGINPRKSLTNTYPKSIPREYHKDFIRGFLERQKK